MKNGDFSSIQSTSQCFDGTNGQRMNSQRIQMGPDNTLVGGGNLNVSSKN